MKKMLAVFTSIVAALAVTGVAWAATADENTSTSATAVTEAAADVSTDASLGDTSTSTAPNTASSTPTTVANSTTSTSITALTATTAAADTTTSTTVDADDVDDVDDDFDDDDDDDDDDDRDDIDHDDDDVDDNEIDIETSLTSEGTTTHTIPGVGTVTIEFSGGELTLVSVNVPGWDVERDRIDSDRIELEFKSGAAEAEFEAKVHDGRVEVELEVGDD